MKQISIIFILIILTINGIDAQDFSLSATLVGFEDNTEIIINPCLDNMDLDFENEITIYLNNGKFEFNRKLDRPTKFSIRVRSIIPNEIAGFEHLTFWAENIPMTLNGTKGKIFQSKITGSILQDQYYQHISSVASFVNEEKQIADSVKTISNLPNDIKSEMRIRYHDLISNRNNEREKFINNNPNYYCTAPEWVWYITFSPDKIDYTKIKEFYTKMNPNFQSNIYGKQIKTFLENGEERYKIKSLETGDYPLDFTLKDPSGNEIKFSSINGKIILLDFWAAWCGPCRLEHKNYVELYNEFKVKGFEIVSVSQDRSKSKLLDAMKKDNITWISLWDENKNVSNGLYNVSSLPTNYLIMDGKIVAMKLRGEKLRHKIEEILNETEN